MRPLHERLPAREINLPTYTSRCHGSTWPWTSGLLNCGDQDGSGGQGRLPGQADLAFLRLPELWASSVAQMVKNPPAVQETRVQSLG